MTMLVPLAAAKAHLRVDTDDDDADLELKLHSASGAVLTYLKSGANLFKDGNGAIVEDLMPFEVKAATLLMLGYFYKDRDNDKDREYEEGRLPRPVTALLYPFRDPALA